MDISNQLIFLAEDDADNCELFAEALQKVSATSILEQAEDGVVLLQKLYAATRIPDVIFLDLNMPRKNGWECIAEIKATPRFQDIPVVIFSASSRERDKEQLYQAGATLFIVKPDCFQHLIQVIRDVLLYISAHKTRPITFQNLR